MCISVWLLGVLVLMAATSRSASAGELRVGVFDVEVSPPVGSPLAYDPCVAVAMPLRAKGIILVPDESPVVLCAIDWIGIANDGQTRWRKALAEAAGTSVDRLAVHTLHQHDAPFCDFSAEALLAAEGLEGTLFDVPFMERAIDDVAAAVSRAMGELHTVTHIGTGMAKVDRVASNRRVMGDDGKVRGVRYTACRDPELRAAPEGTIDPLMRTLSLWNGDQPIAVLTYYATHPQSYYRTGVANPDFPGMARQLREVTQNGLPHIHFNGAGGNIGAGKYNDGSPENRQLLAQRMADGMLASWKQTTRVPISSDQFDWRVERVALPPSHHLDREQLVSIIKDASQPLNHRQAAACDLAWLQRCQAGETVELSCLRLGDVRVLHLPGEAVVEYQLSAQALQPDKFVAVAAYGDYAPGYICLEKHYAEGGYESSPRASRVAPNVEQPMLTAIGRLLRDEAGVQ